MYGYVRADTNSVSTVSAASDLNDSKNFLHQSEKRLHFWDERGPTVSKVQ